MKSSVICLALLLAVGCGDGSTSGPGSPRGLDALPPDTGGDQTAFVRSPDDADAPVYGAHIYVPGGAEASPVPYPLLVFLHGAGERGDSADDPARLDAVLRNGPPRLIDRGEWDPVHPMIVVSPQCHEGWWSSSSIRELLEWVDARYDIDRSRIYLTGLSMGGFGTWSYLAAYGNDDADPLPIAAAVPICGGGNPGAAESIAGTPVWAFHGTSDGTVNVDASISMVKAIGVLESDVPPRLTLYDGVGHNSWSRTYDGSGVGQGLETYTADTAVDSWLAPLDQNVYAWLFGHRR